MSTNGVEGFRDHFHPSSVHRLAAVGGSFKAPPQGCNSSPVTELHTNRKKMFAVLTQDCAEQRGLFHVFLLYADNTLLFVQHLIQVLWRMLREECRHLHHEWSFHFSFQLDKWTNEKLILVIRPHFVPCQRCVCVRRLDSDWFYPCSTFPKIIKAYGSFCRENSSRVQNHGQINLQKVSAIRWTFFTADDVAESVGVCYCVFLKPPRSSAYGLPGRTCSVGACCSLRIALLAASAYVSEVCPWPKINVVNTALWMNKFPGTAATPWPVINKLIHGVIHSLKCSQPLFIPRIYVCCYFSESAERNHARGKINHIFPP